MENMALKPTKRTYIVPHIEIIQMNDRMGTLLTGSDSADQHTWAAKSNHMTDGFDDDSENDNSLDGGAGTSSKGYSIWDDD